MRASIRAAVLVDDRDSDATILRLAARQHGVVSREQIVAAGIPSHRIDYRLRRGRLVRLHHGVYGAGLPGPRAREVAAVLACGNAAVVSHESVSAMWDCIPPLRRDTPVDVSLRHGNRMRRTGIRVHRPVELLDDEITELDGIPVTTPERTMLDLASVAGGHVVERALARAMRSGRIDEDVLDRLLARHAGRSGVALLRVLLATPGGPALTRSGAESRFLALMRRAGVRTPEANRILEGYEVDFLWRSERLIVEIDGFAYHSSRSAFERDRRRDLALTAAGFRVIHVTWRELENRPEALIRQIVQALAGGG